jgi:hypothetical protein
MKREVCTGTEDTDKLRTTAIALRHYLVLSEPYVNPKHRFSRRIRKMIEETSWLDQ